MWRAHDGMGWWMLLSSMLWLLFWATVVYLFAAALSGPRERRGSPGEMSPLDIAARRYASGEITSEQFQQLREDLTGASGPLSGGRREAATEPKDASSVGGSGS